MQEPARMDNAPELRAGKACVAGRRPQPGGPAKCVPSQQPAGKSSVGLLWCSAGVNLLLLLLVSALARNHSEPALPAPPARAAVAREIPPASRETVVASEVSDTNRVSFHWAQLESDDFRAYIANLRAVRCPESIIRDLIFHDLERAYTIRQARLPTPDLFWKSAEVRESTSETREQQCRELEQEKRAVMRELLGVSWSKEAWQFWYNDSFAEIAEVLAGFLKNEQVLGAVTAYFDMERTSGDLRDECNLCSEAAERTRREAAYHRVVDAFGAVMSASELEELALRISVVDGNLDGRSETEFRFRDGAELRAYARLCNQFKPFFSEPFLGDPDDDDTRSAQLQSAVRALLGEARFASFDRSQNAAYQEMCRFAQEKNLPPDTILKAWQVREAAEQELAQLATRNDLSQTEQSAAGAEVRRQTEAALAILLGDANSAEYLKQHGGWLKPPPKTGGKS